MTVSLYSPQIRGFEPESLSWHGDCNEYYRKTIRQRSAVINLIFIARCFTIRLNSPKTNLGGSDAHSSGDSLPSHTSYEEKMVNFEVTQIAVEKLKEILAENVGKCVRVFVQGIG